MSLTRSTGVRACGIPRMVERLNRWVGPKVCHSRREDTGAEEVTRALPLPVREDVRREVGLWVPSRRYAVRELGETLPALLRVQAFR
jgi:hypothetical protein